MMSTKTVVSNWRTSRSFASCLHTSKARAAHSRLRQRQSLGSPIRQTSAAAAASSSMTSEQVRSIPEQVKGRLGGIYKIESILQDRGPPFSRVFLAGQANQKYILKEVPHHNYEFRKGIYDRLGTQPHIRGLADTAPDQSIFIFDYFDHHLLGLVQKNLSLAATKQILKHALQGLAAMHAKDIVHNDIKPNNIFISASDGPEGLTIKQTVLADLEDSAYCPPPGNLMGAQLGNWMWRSPEAHAEGPMNKPSDIFAFAIVCIYAITRRMIFYVSPDQIAEGEELLAIVLERQLSYFGNPDMFGGFLEYVASANPGNPWIEIFRVIQNGFSAEYPREPFALWQEEPPLDEQFRDLILQMTRFDPRRRITAHEALEHEWFKGV